MFCNLCNRRRSCHRLRGRTGGVGGRLLGVGGMTGMRIFNVRGPMVRILMRPSLVTRANVAATSVVHTFSGRGGIISTKTIRGKGGHLHVRTHNDFAGLTRVRGVAVVSKAKRCFQLGRITGIDRRCVHPTHGLVGVGGAPTLNVTVSAMTSNGIISVTTLMGGAIRHVGARVPSKCGLAPVCSRNCRSTITGSNFVLGLVVSIVAIITILLFFVNFGGKMLVKDKLIFSVFTALVCVRTGNVTLRHVSLTTVVVTVKVLMSGTVIMFSSTLVGVRQKVQGQGTVVGTVSSATVPLLTTAIVTVLAFVPICLSPSVAKRLLSSLFVMVTMSLLFD